MQRRRYKSIPHFLKIPDQVPLLPSILVSGARGHVGCQCKLLLTLLHLHLSPLPFLDSRYVVLVPDCISVRRSPQRVQTLQSVLLFYLTHQHNKNEILTATATKRAKIRE